jgi:hypothetical protein
VARRNGLRGFDFRSLTTTRYAFGSLGDLNIGETNRKTGVSVTFQNVDLVRTILGEVEDGLRNPANKYLRDASQEIAQQVVIPQLKRAARSSPMKMARAFADTAVARRDRIVLVQIGGKAPALEGFKRGVGIGKVGERKTMGGRSATSKNAAAGLAWGSEYGPWPDAKVNNYGQPRRDPGGYWVTQGVTNAVPEATRRYSQAIEHLIARYGGNR